MRIPTLHIVVLASAGLFACEVPTGSKPGGIIDGVLNEGDPAVVALLHGDQAFCTGTLIAPGVVVTAAHCLVEDGMVIVPTQIEIGTVADGVGETIPVAWAEPYPHWGTHLFFGDAALIGLASPSLVPPIPIRRASIDQEAVGTMMRFVGFGFTKVEAMGELGTKFTGGAPLEGVDPEFLVYGQVTCGGDSGGPAFLVAGNGVEELAGLTSHGPRACGDFGSSYSTRVDTLAGWIDERVVVSAATCELDRRCVAGCAADPDCSCVSDGRCDQCPDREDPDCALGSIGDSCEGDASCIPGVFCVEGLCRRACVEGRRGACPALETCMLGAGEPRTVCLSKDDVESQAAGCASSVAARPDAVTLALLALLTLRRRRRRSR